MQLITTFYLSHEEIIYCSIAGTKFYFVCNIFVFSFYSDTTVLNLDCFDNNILGSAVLNELEWIPNMSCQSTEHEECTVDDPLDVDTDPFTDTAEDDAVDTCIEDQASS